MRHGAPRAPSRAQAPRPRPRPACRPRESRASSTVRKGWPATACRQRAEKEAAGIQEVPRNAEVVGPLFSCSETPQRTHGLLFAWLLNAWWGALLFPETPKKKHEPLIVWFLHKKCDAKAGYPTRGGIPRQLMRFPSSEKDAK